MAKTRKKPSKAEVEKKVLRILEKAREEPKYRASRERDALIAAIKRGETQVALSLLAHGVDPDATDVRGKSALWHAAHSSRDEIVRGLVKKNAKLPEDVLMGPVYDSDASLVKFLIDKGANVNCVATITRPNSKFPEKQVLLTMAISEAEPGKLESIPIMLIKAGAKINRLAYENSSYQGYIRSLLGLAALKGLEKIVTAMLAAGADVNYRDSWGGTALLDAAFEGQTRIVKILLKAGAQADIQRKDGFTAISAARHAKFDELTELIANRN